MRITSLVAAVLTVATGCKKEPAAEPGQAEGIDIEDPRTCAPCHQAVLDEWRESMHARAHHEQDPIYAGIRALRMAKEGEAIADACAGCHTPRAAGRRGRVAKAGVTCATCHNVAAVHAGKRGRAALETAAAGLLLGPHDLAGDATPAHGTGPTAPHLRDGATICLACHGTMRSGSGVPICTTGPERAEAPDDGETCASCHMPVVAGKSGPLSQAQTHRSHRFEGPHRAWYQDDPALLKRAVRLSGTLGPAGLELTLKNVSGHAFPTGFPGRQAVLKVEAPGVEWPEAKPIVLGKRYVDIDGKPTLAPWAVRLASDTRLRPGESRVIRLEPPAGATSVRVTLALRLLPPPLAKKLSLAGAVEGEIRVIEVLEIRAPGP